MTDKRKAMTWAELGAWIATLTPKQLAMPVVILGEATNGLTTVAEVYFASADERREVVYSYSWPPLDLKKGQPVLLAR